jgi:2-hydroxyacyl-CoA lyase 1
MIPSFVRDAYRAALFGRPGPAFVDLPANLILGHFDVDRQVLKPLPEAPKSVAPQSKIHEVAEALKGAKAPLVVVGKGVAYARAERQVRRLIDQYGQRSLSFFLLLFSQRELANWIPFPP